LKLEKVKLKVTFYLQTAVLGRVTMISASSVRLVMIWTFSSMRKEAVLSAVLKVMVSLSTDTAILEGGIPPGFSGLFR
jgi:hypothetical protein